jgi:hypothetical protein
MSPCRERWTSVSSSHVRDPAAVLYYDDPAVHIMRTQVVCFATFVFCAFLAITTAGAAVVTLPVEVAGEDGTTAGITVDVPPRLSGEVRSLWMQIHGLSYADMVSVQVNDGAWVSLNNNTAAVGEPGRSYGGIGGSFATLKVTVALQPGTVVDGANTVRFRFNHSDGVVSGFRVVAFNFLRADSSTVLNADAFVQDDPDTWTPPLTDSESILQGRELWRGARLVSNSLPNAPIIRAHCADCHAYDGRDLKYFGYSNASIIARSRFHGLSDLAARQIASYIRSLPVPSPGRPWNPPYQPGPGLDGQPVSNWAAGAGLSSVVESDSETLPFLFGLNAQPDWKTIAPDTIYAAFRPDGNLNVREVPISFQLPDWNHWLPRVHPLDAWGPDFQKSEFAAMYSPIETESSGNYQGQAKAPKQSLGGLLGSSALSELIGSGRIAVYFDKWLTARRALLKPVVERGGITWTPELMQKVYSTQLWQLVKTWEMTQALGLEGRGSELFETNAEPRTWFNAIPAAAAPAAANIPDGPSGMGGSALINAYFSASWYELQILLNSGNHRHRGRFPVDWVYVIGQFQNLYGESHRPEPSRVLLAVIKAWQSTDPQIGPEDVTQGWRPSQNVDPAIMVRSEWTPIFQPLSEDAKRVITQSFLTAWLEKNLQYPVGQYFRVGRSDSAYALPAEYGSIAGGNVWESAPSFIAAGVNPDLVQQLQKWGVAYTNMAARFQYAPKGTTSRPRP